MGKAIFVVAITPGLKATHKEAEEIVEKHLRPFVMKMAEETGDYETTGKVFLGAVNHCIARNKKLLNK